MAASRGRQTARHVPAGLERGLRNYWYPVLASADLTDGPVACRYLGEDLVAWRDSQGTAHLFPDYCPHRAARLSIGTVLGDTLQCIFHGIRFAGDGRCALMPWEPDGSPMLRKIRAVSYPVVERRGLIFAYLGDAARFPPPPPEAELPADLWDEAAVGYVLSETWEANWLLALDGADRYHLPILHARSAVQRRDGPAPDPAASESGADRRLAVARGERRLAVAATDAAGRAVVTGMEADAAFADQGFHLPALLALAVQAQAGTRPYRIFLWLFPIDEQRTQVTRYISRYAPTAAEREEWETFFHAVVRPRTLQVSAEDARVAVSQRSLAFARGHEQLLPPDGEIYQRRLLLRDAFLTQQEGRRLAPRLGASLSSQVS